MFLVACYTSVTIVWGVRNTNIDAIDFLLAIVAILFTPIIIGATKNEKITYYVPIATAIFSVLILAAVNSGLGRQIG